MKVAEKKIALFDIDGTIFRSSLVIELSHALVEAGIFPRAAERQIAKEYSEWLDRKGSYEAYIGKVVEIYVKYIGGKSFSRVSHEAQKVIHYQKNRVYRYSRDLIKELKKKGYFLVAISGSPSYIVEEYAKATGFDLCFGTKMEIIKDKFTGRVLNLDSAYRKGKIVRQLCQQWKVNLQKSLAVGDTESDIKMLSIVGRPIAFNPNFSLAKHALRKGWEIVVERKDVIYKVKDFKIPGRSTGIRIS